MTLEGTRGDADAVVLGVRYAEEYLRAAVAIVAAADAGALVGIPVGRDGAAGDGDIAAVGVVAAPDSCGLPSAVRGDGTAVDIDGAIAVLAAADTRAVVAAGGRDGTAVDGDAAALAGGLALAAADACGVVAALGRDGAAVDHDGSGVAALATADARAVVSAGSADRAAPDGDRTAVGALHGLVLAVAAADARAVMAALGRDGTAVDGDGAALAGPSAADARAGIAAGGRDGTAVHGEAADILEIAVIASDARTVVVALGFDSAAMDDEIATLVPGVGADACAAGGMGVYLARAGALTVDGQRAALGNVQALHVQRAAVAQDQVGIALQGYAAVHGDVFVQAVPAGVDRAAVGEGCRISVFCILDDTRAVPAPINVGNVGDAFVDPHVVVGEEDAIIPVVRMEVFLRRIRVVCGIARRNDAPVIRVGDIHVRAIDHRAGDVDHGRRDELQVIVCRAFPVVVYLGTAGGVHDRRFGDVDTAAAAAAGIFKNLAAVQVQNGPRFVGQIDAAAPFGGRVAGDGAAGDGQRAAVPDAAAIPGAAALDGAAADGQRAAVVDAAAHVARARPAVGDGAATDHQGALIVDGAAVGIGRDVPDLDIIERQGALVPDRPAAVSEVHVLDRAVSQRQPCAFADAEDAFVVAVYPVIGLRLYQIRAQVDHDILSGGNRERHLVASEQKGIPELDIGVAVGGVDGVPERVPGARALVLHFDVFAHVEARRQHARKVAVRAVALHGQFILADLHRLIHGPVGSQVAQRNGVVLRGHDPARAIPDDEAHLYGRARIVILRLQVLNAAGLVVSIAVQGGMRAVDAVFRLLVRYLSAEVAPGLRRRIVTVLNGTTAPFRAVALRNQTEI